MPFISDEELASQGIMPYSNGASSFISDEELASQGIVLNNPVSSTKQLQKQALPQPSVNRNSTWEQTRPTNNIAENAVKDARDIVLGLSQLVGMGANGVTNILSNPEEAKKSVAKFGNSIVNDLKDRKANSEKFYNGELSYKEFLEAQRLSARKNHPQLLGVKDALVSGIKEQYGQEGRDISKEGIDVKSLAQSFVKHPLMNTLDVIGLGEVGKIKAVSNATSKAYKANNAKRALTQDAQTSLKIQQEIAKAKANGVKVDKDLINEIAEKNKRVTHFTEDGRKYRLDINGNPQYFNAPTDNLVLRPIDILMQSEGVQKLVNKGDNIVQDAVGQIFGLKENHPLLGQKSSAKARLRELEKARKQKAKEELLNAQKQNAENFGSLEEAQGKDIIKTIEGEQVAKTSVAPKVDDAIENAVPDIKNAENVVSDANSLRGNIADATKKVSQTGNIVNKTNADGIVEINGKYYWDNAKGEIPEHIAPESHNGVVVDGKSYVEIGDVPKDLKTVEQPFEAIADDVKNVAKTEENKIKPLDLDELEEINKNYKGNPKFKEIDEEFKNADNNVQPVKTEEKPVLDNSVPKEDLTPVNDVPSVRTKEDIQNEIAQINKELKDARHRGMTKQARKELVHEKNVRLKELRNELKEQKPKDKSYSRRNPNINNRDNFPLSKRETNVFDGEHIPGKRFKVKDYSNHLFADEETKLALQKFINNNFDDTEYFRFIKFNDDNINGINFGNEFKSGGIIINKNLGVADKVSNFSHEVHHSIMDKLAKVDNNIRKIVDDGIKFNNELYDFEKSHKGIKEKYINFENAKSNGTIDEFKKTLQNNEIDNIIEYGKKYENYRNCDYEKSAREASKGVWSFGGKDINEYKDLFGLHGGGNRKVPSRKQKTYERGNKEEVRHRTNSGSSRLSSTDVPQTTQKIKQKNETVINDLFNAKNKLKSKLKENSDFYKSIGKLSDDIETDNIIDTFAAYRNGKTKRSQITDDMRKEAIKIINSLPEDKKPFYVPRMYNEHLTKADFGFGHQRSLDDIGELKGRKYTGDADKIKGGKLTRSFNIEEIANRLDKHRIKLQNMSNYLDDIKDSFAKPLDKIENLKDGYVVYDPENIKNVFFGKVKLDDLTIEQLKETRSLEAALKNALEKNSSELINDITAIKDKIQKSNGNLYQIPKEIYNELTKSFSYKSNTASTIWDIGTTMFKKNSLGLNAKWFINNRIGNTILAAFKGTNLLNPLTMKKISKLTDDLFPTDLVNNTFNASEKAEVYKLPKTGNQKLDALISIADGQSVVDSKVLNALSIPGKVVNKITKTVFDINNKFETLDRKTVYLSKVNKHKKEILKATGKRMMTDKEILNYVKDNETLRNKILEEVNDVLGDYSSMTHTERNVIKRLIPFYSWLRTITRHTMSLPRTNPIRTSINAKIASLFYEENDDLPEYQKGAVKTGLRSEKDNKEMLLNFTHSVPYSTFSETGDNPMSLFHPVINNVVNGISSQKSFSNMPLQSKNYEKNYGGGYTKIGGDGTVTGLPTKEKLKHMAIQTTRDIVPGLKQTERVLGGVLFDKRHRPYDKLWDTDFGGYMEEDVRKKAKGFSGKEQIARYFLPIQKQGNKTKANAGVRQKKHKRMLNKE